MTTSAPNVSPTRAIVNGGGTTATVAFVGPTGQRYYKYGPIAYIDTGRSDASVDLAAVNPTAAVANSSPPAGGASTASLNGSVASRQRRRTVAVGVALDKPNSTGWLVALQQKLFENYHIVAYTVVISTYFLAFCEYVYLRLIAIVFPDRLVYYRQCRKHANETIVRNEIHFASTTIVFVAVGTFQITCFYLLTVSERLLDVRRTVSAHFFAKEQIRHELAFAIRRVMFTTAYAAFAVYVMCAAVVLCVIFYVIGIRDGVNIGSQILAHFFDGCAILYFLAFPVVCILFHSDLRPGKQRKLLASPTGEHQYAAPIASPAGRESDSRYAAGTMPRTAAVQQQQRQIKNVTGNAEAESANNVSPHLDFCQAKSLKRSRQKENGRSFYDAKSQMDRNMTSTAIISPIIGSGVNHLSTKSKSPIRSNQLRQKI